MTEKLLVFASGTLFAIGLGISGMTDANKVIHFLNPLGGWDPSLAFVMVGAIGAHLATRFFIIKRGQPVFAETFSLPTVKDIDKRLLLGSALFGVGWAMGGFCPGPGLVSSVSGGLQALTFVGAMVLGMVAYHLTLKEA